MNSSIAPGALANVHPAESVRQALAAGAPARGSLIGVATLAAVCSLALLVRRYDAPAVLAGIVALAAILVLFLKPGWATLAVVFLLYTNLPTLAYRNYGVPQVAASAFILLLGFPLLHHAVVWRERLRADVPLRLMLVYLGALLLCTLGAKDAGLAAAGIQRYIFEGLLLYWLLVNVLRDSAQLRRAIWVVLTAGALLGALTLYQDATGALHQQFGGLAQRNYEYLSLREESEKDPENSELQEAVASYSSGNRSRRAGGPVSEPNRFAQILIVLLPLALWARRTARSASARTAAAGTGLLILGGIVLSGSRGAALILLLVLAGVVRLRWIRPAYVLTGALVLLPLVPVVAPAYFERIGSITSVLQISRNDSSTEVDGAIRGRATSMLAAWQVFRDHPVLGVGPGQYVPFYSVAYQQKDPRLKFRDLRSTRRAHSLYLEMAAELGLVGLLAFLAIGYWFLRELGRMRHRWALQRPEFADLATAFRLSLLAYFGTAIFLHFSYERYFWFLLAFAGAAIQLMRSSEMAAATAARTHPADSGTEPAYASAAPASPRRSDP
jgi:hypothetical protein